ncbi:MAG: Sua5/YciO/YrdC/YwlC family protein [Gammaproteobacteria bacterium]|nr:tRNA threonylcarbamoyladenosine biosynthesis protein RimN [Chromatiales bacterium]MDP6674345.1 Sua5/YciO/YrdC/YwlC family protein [Gammaproteobacteria bacterium]
MPAAISFVHLRQAARIIHDGGVVAYPTEGVFGLGCDPWQQSAVLRILEIKERALAAGLILIAADRRQLDGWIDPSAEEERALATTDPFVTWVVTADPDCPDWITGGRTTCAVRITQHPVAAALCRETDLALVSTSANRHGQASATAALTVRCILGQSIDFIMPGTVGAAPGPSEIRCARTGAVLRAG